MTGDRALTLHFVDGTRICFDFPEQTKNVAARQLRIEEFLSSNNVVIEADGSLLMFPMANIKYLQFSLADGLPSQAVKLPGAVILGATIVS